MTRRWIGLIALAVGAGVLSVSAAQDAGAPAGPVQLTAQADRQRIMDLLQITSIPPGAQGSNNPATYDESQANPFPTLPDPLVLKNGKKVSSKDSWWKQRRPEILEDFEREIYGRTPTNTPN